MVNKHLINLKHFKQDNGYACGPACLEMVFRHFGKKISEAKLTKMAKTKKSGTSHVNMIKVASKEGFYCYVHNHSSINQIKHFIDLNLPVIVNYIEPKSEEGHYAVVVGYKRNKIILDDPWNGKNFKLSVKEFKKRWYDYHKKHKYSRWILVISKNKFNLGKQYSPA
ncbi:MAG: cysteine peptidase family C39 domain-containing protein [Nanoarchaeota archaeon]